MNRPIQNSAHRRESGDPGFFRCSGPNGSGGASRGSETQNTWVPAFAGMSGMLGFLTPTLAMAHPGDHTAMTVAQVAHHIATSPDHLLEVGFAVLMVFGEGLRVRRRRAR